MHHVRTGSWARSLGAAVLLCAGGWVHAQTAPQLILSSPTNRVQIVSADPGGAAEFTVLVTNTGDTASSARFRNRFEVPPRGSIRFRNVIGPCLVSDAALDNVLEIDALSVPARTTVTCRFRAERSSGLMIDPIIEWNAHPNVYGPTGPVGASIYVGSPVSLEWNVQPLSFARRGDEWVQRARVTVTNRGPHDIVDAGFNVCIDDFRFTVTSAASGGCNLPVQGTGYPCPDGPFGIGNVAAGASASCELDIVAATPEAGPQPPSLTPHYDYLSASGQRMVDLRGPIGYVLPFGTGTTAVAVPSVGLAGWLVLLAAMLIGAWHATHRR